MRNCSLAPSFPHQISSGSLPKSSLTRTSHWKARLNLYLCFPRPRLKVPGIRVPAELVGRGLSHSSSASLVLLRAPGTRGLGCPGAMA